MAAEASATTEPVKDTMDDMLKLSVLREDAKAELLEILQNIHGPKCLITDVQLGGLLNQVIAEGSRFLKDNDVEHFRQLRDEPLGHFINSEGQQAVPDNIIYIVRPQLPLMNLIASQLKSAERNGIECNFHVYFVPQRFTVCVHLLEEQLDRPVLFSRIQFGEYKMGLIPYDTDILSLEMGDCFKQCNVDGDFSSLNIIAEALLKVQMQFGIIPNVRSKGHASKKVLQKMMAMRVEELEYEQAQLAQQSALTGGGGSGAGGSGGANFGSPSGAYGGVPSVSASARRSVLEKYSARSEIDLLVIMDRDVDLVSPLVTPLTYEGLIDDTVGIENGRVKLDAAVLGSSEQDALTAKMAATATASAGKAGVDGAAAAAAASAAAQKTTTKVGDKVAVALNNNDAIFAEIRDLSIERLGGYLQDKAIHIRERYTTFRDNKDASITEIHDFVKKIPKLTMEYKSLNQHINIAEMLKQRTDSRAFLDQWQEERGMLEGDTHLDEVEELLASDVKRSQLLRVLRMLCLQSVTSGGIRAARLDAIRRMVAHSYGYQHLYTMSNLEKAGLLKRKDALIVVEISTQWAQLRKALRLIDERSNEESISYVTAGYAPMLVRLVQLLCLNGVSWDCIADTLRQLPGPVLEFTQQASTPEELSEALDRTSHEALSAGGSAGPAGGGGGLNPNNLLSGVMSSASAGANFMRGGASGGDGDGSGTTTVRFTESTPQDKKTMLLFVVGGLSYLEVAALRFLSQDPNFPYRILIATTKLVNGSALINSLKHKASEA